ncbi:uncharacterized protein LOC126799364 isoform X2 [Argentina anserina]|uniref:uncharacterized protein LOC126799364 isoform X2 n=1 Tax=Argentina anserina TaxID=57926 RepID=UPI0021766A80|nr:uncharacterized protein LOC126799364 isoform X2 [Potentilla anserina]
MESAAAESIDGGDRDVELNVIPRQSSSASDADGGGVTEERSPLLSQAEKPKINIFTLSYPRRNPGEEVIRSLEPEISAASQFLWWVWSGSRYSGLMCMAISSTIYFTMEVVTDIFSVQPIPLLEVAFTRCTVILVLSYMWLRKVGQPLSGLGNAKHLLISRAFMGYVSLLSFIYCIQRLSLSQAIVLSLTTPIIASVVARFILHETYKVAEIGGLACSFFGVLFIFQLLLTTQDQQGEGNNTSLSGSSHIYAILAASLSSITGGISYCLIRAGAKSCDQPLLTVFSFGVLATPAAGICLFVFEVFLARGLQLEKTSKVANVLYMEAALSQLWVIGSARIAPTFGRIFGCLLIFISVFCTMYIGPDKED